MKHLTFILFFQLAWFDIYSQIFNPVSTSGYDIDAIAEVAPNALATTTKELDDIVASNKVMYSVGFASTLGFTGGLPNSGTIINGTKTYQLRPYNGNNCLFAQTATTKTLTVSTPAQFSKLSFLVFSTEGSSTMNVKVNYTDLTSTSMGSFIIADWFGGPSPAYCCIGRCSRIANVTSVDGIPSDPNLYSFDVNLSCVDQLKNVKSIEFNTTVGTLAAYVMAVSGVSVSTVVNTLNYPSNILCSNSSSVSPIITGASGGTFIATPAGLNLNASSGIINPFGSALNNYTVSYLSPGLCSTISIFTLSVFASPTISVNSGTICSGNSFTLAPSGALSYTFSGGSSIVSPSVSTNYTVTGTNVAGCVGLNTSTLTVQLTPTISVNSGTICNGNSFTLTPSGAVSYTFSGGSSIVSPSVSTNYTVTGTNAASCVGSNTSTLTVQLTPTISVNSGTICNGSSFTLTPSGAVSYTYSGGSSIVSPSVSTNYTVTGTNAAGCVGFNTSSLTVQLTPTISVNSGTICSGNSFTLTPSGAVSYTFSGGSSIVSPSVSANYTVTGTNAAGCVGSNTSTLTVQLTPTISVNSGTICSGSSFTIIPSGAFSYTYSGGSNIVSPILTTNYTVIGSSSGGCLSLAVVNTVVVNSTPSLTINSGTICNGSSFTLTPSGALSYTFSSGSNVVSPIATTNYTVFGISSFGCLSLITNTVFVVITPIIVPSSSPSSICKNEQAILSAFGATSYTWMPGSFVGNTITVFPLSTTIFTVFGTNSSSGLTCNSSNTVLVNVKPLSNVSAFSNTSICVGDFALISATGGDIYSWQPIIGVLNPTLSITNVKPLITTIYTVTAIATGSCSNTSTVQIIVNPLPYVNAGVDTVINIDESYILNGTGNVTVGFIPLDGNPLNCNFCSVVEVSPKENTCYTLKGITSFGCVNSDDICITVTKDYNIYIPNAFSPNGDFDNEVFIPVGFGLSEIKLFVFDRWGVEIFRSSDENLGWDGKVKGKACPQGVYVYQVKITTLGGKKIIRAGHVTLLSKVQ